MTEQQNLRQLAEKAVPGPWWWGGNTDHQGDVGLRGIIKDSGVVDVLRTVQETVDEKSALAEWVKLDSDEQSYYGTVADYQRYREEHAKHYLSFLSEDRFFVEEGRLKAIYQVALNQGLPETTPRSHPKVYRADVKGVNNANAKFIAAADPTTVLALLDERDKYLEALQQLQNRFGTDTEIGEYVNQVLTPEK